LSFDENSAFQKREATAHFFGKDSDSKGSEKSGLGSRGGAVVEPRIYHGTEGNTIGSWQLAPRVIRLLRH